MFLTEPIVLYLLLLRGSSDFLIFAFEEAFQAVLKRWGFNICQIGLFFLS